MTPNPFTMTGPVEVLLGQFGNGLYVAMSAVTLRISPHLDTRWGTGFSYMAPSANQFLATVACPCGTEIEVELRGTEAAEIARYCLRTGHCTFIRLPTPQPPCEHWQSIPFDPGIADTKGHS